MPENVEKRAPEINNKKNGQLRPQTMTVFFLTIVWP